MPMTVGDFTRSISDIASSLNTLADNLSTCSMEVEIDTSMGKKVVCQMPVVGGDQCRLKTVKDPRVADLHEGLLALAAWAADIQASLAGLDPSDPLFASGEGPGPDPVENA